MSSPGAGALAALGQVARGVSHDVNNLLAVVLGHASLAYLDLPEDSPARAALVQIRRAARQAAALSGQVLDLAGNGTAPRAEVLDLTALVSDMSTLLRVAMPRTVHFQCLVPAGPTPVLGEASALRQVLMNLLLNAARAVEDRGSVDLELEVQGERIQLRVRDDGCGMSPEVSARVFEAGFSTRGSGHGWGLATVATLVRRHEGSIDVESTPGGGSCFTVTLPLSAEQPAVDDRTAPDIAHWQGIGRVLLLEENADLRNITARSLQRYGLEVAAHGTPRSALESLRKAPEAFALALLDLGTAELAPGETLRALRRIAPGLPVVWTSGEGSQVTQDLRDPFNGFLAKPFDHEQLGLSLRRVLG